MSEQLALDTGDAVARTRYRTVDDDTLEPSKSLRAFDGPAGCVRCGLEHDGARWTGREPHAVVWIVGGLCYCPQHGEHEVRRLRADRAAEQTRRAAL